MKAFIWILASAVFCISSTVFASESGSVSVSHYEPLQRLSIQTNTDSGSAKPSASGSTSLNFDALGRTFNLQLEPNSGLLSRAARNALSGDIQAYRGQLAGNSDSWVRIVVADGVPSGLVWDGQQLFAIEAPGDSAVQTTSPVIYRLADTMIAPGSMSCGVASTSGNGAATFQKLGGELTTIIAQGPGAVREIEIGAVGDYEFTNARGANASAAIITRLNNVDGIYSQELGVQITVDSVTTFTDSADPFSGATDSSALLVELADYREATPAQNSLGLTHLYTGRDLDGSTVGVAYGSALCRARFGAGLSEGNAGATIGSLIAAHEIGHNFGAPHDGEQGSVCESEPMTFIMAPTVNANNNTFSQCSKNEMADDIAGASCINPLPTVDMEIALSDPLPIALLSADVTLTYNISNNGLNQATNVSVDITLPSNVTLVSTTASDAICPSGAGTVNCLLGDVAGLSNQTVTLSATASTVGTDTLDAVVTSDFDERPANNQETLQLTVDPAVDLAIDLSSSSPINLDTSATISGTVENLSVLDATSVTLSIGLGSGLRADDASWSIGTCTVAAQQVDCQAASFANLSSSSLSVSVTGTSNGRFNYNAALSSAEADADMANNNAFGEIRVRDPKDSGGGAIGLPLVFLLSLATFVVRRRSTRA